MTSVRFPKRHNYNTCRKKICEDCKDIEKRVNELYEETWFNPDFKGAGE